MKKWIILGVLVIIGFLTWFFVFRDTSFYTIKKSGEYEVESGVVTVIIKADDVVIKDSDIHEVRIETSGASVSFSNSTIKFLNVESSDDLNLEIDSESLIEYLNIDKTDNLYLNGDFAMVNLNSSDSKIYLESGVIGNLYSYSSDIEVDIDGNITISNYFIIGASSVTANINGDINYIELDEDSSDNVFNIYGNVELIVNEGEGNTFIIKDGANVSSLKTSDDVLGSGEVDELVTSDENITTDEIVSSASAVSSVINDRKESISNFATSNGVDETVVTTFISQTGYEIEKLEEISSNLEGSNYSVSEILSLADDGGVTNYQLKEVVEYTDNSSLSVADVVNIFDNLDMDSSDISASLDVTTSCDLSVSEVLDIYVYASSAEEVSTDLLFDIKDSYDLSVSDLASLTLHFGKYI